MSIMIELNDLEENSNQDLLEPSVLTSLKNNDIDTFIETLSKDSSNINHLYSQESQPGTLLDIACRECGNSQFVDILLKRGANPNAINAVTGKSPLHEAVLHSDFFTVHSLLQNSNCNVNIVDLDGNSALYYAIIKNKVDLIAILIDHGADYWKDNIRDNYGFTENCLKSNWIENLFKKRNPEFAWVMKKQTSLYAPIIKAARHGYYETLKKLLTDESVSIEPVHGKTILHVILDGILAFKHKENTNRIFIEHCMAGKTGRYPGADAYFPPEKFSLFSDEKQDHHRCLEYILENIPSNRLDINFSDNDGNTALHYAVAWKETKAVEALLQAGAYTCKANKMGMIPLRSFSSQMLEQYLDSCITSNDCSLDHTDYQIIFDFKMFMSPVTQLKESCTNEECYRKIRESEPILIMYDVPRLRKLLIHPLIRSYLHQKWRIVRKYFYYNLILYLFFWFFLSSYLFYDFYTSTSPSSSSSSSRGIPKTDGFLRFKSLLPFFPNHSKNPTESAFASNFTSTANDVNQPIFWNFWDLWRIVTVIFCTMLILKSGYQLYILRRPYLKSAENWLELSLFALTFVLLTLTSKLSPNWRTSLSGIVILGSWAELMLLMGRHPYFSIHVEMFKTVSSNFLKSLLLYSIMIIAFAFSFYVLFKGRSNERNESTMFNHFLTSILKTLIMLTGEYDSSTIPFGDSFNITHIFFILFLFLIEIVLFNLLSGLAVGDIQKIRGDAEVVAIVSCIKFISCIETMATTGLLDNRHISIFFRWRNGKFITFPNRGRLTRTKLDPRIIEDAVNTLRKTKQLYEKNDHTECCRQMEEYKMKLQKLENVLLNLSTALMGKFNPCPGGQKSRKNKPNIVRRTESAKW